MQGKLEHCLISTKSKKGFPGKVNLKDACFSHAQEHGAAFVAEKATSVLKYLIRHMNIIGRLLNLDC